MRAMLLAGVMMLGLSGKAEASFVTTFNEISGDVVAQGSGTLNINGFGRGSTFTTQTNIYPSRNAFDLGANAGIFQYVLSGPGNTGPSSFGTGGLALATSGTGDAVGFGFRNGMMILDLPINYVSGGSLNSSAVFANADLATLGLTLGTYVYEFSSGMDQDSFVIQVGPTTAVPEPTSFGLLAAGLAAFGVVRRRRLVRCVREV